MHKKQRVLLSVVVHMPLYETARVTVHDTHQFIFGEYWTKT